MARKKEKGLKITKKEKKDEESEKLAVREPRWIWDPWEMMRRFDEEFEDFRRDIERAFWEPSFFSRPRLFRWPRLKFPEIGLREVKEPLVDIRDTGKELVVEAEIPGIPKENIDIELTEDSIKLSGEIERKDEEEREGYYRQEISRSSFYREMSLPEEIIPGKSEAELEDGILKITLPKKTPTEEPKTHKLKVK